MFVKICGVTTEDDALTAAALGADAVGVNFVASSSRRVSPGQARDLVHRLPPEILTVGIFRDEPPESVVRTANRVGLRAVQLHGSETPEDTRWIAARVPNVIRAVAAGSRWLERAEEFGTARLLVDAPEPGSGKPFDWYALAADPPSRPYILAGGLDPENVARAVRLLRPWGVDVASGVESRPGHKDPTKVRAFVRAAREAAAELDEPTDASPDAPRTPESDHDGPPPPTADDRTGSIVGADQPYDWELD